MAFPLAFPLAFSLAPLATAVATSVSGWFSGSRNSKTNKEIAEQQQANQLKLAYLNIQAQKNLEENRQGFQGDLEMSRQQFQERMTYLGFKQQRDLKELDQQFQLRLRELDHQHQQEVEEFRAKVNVAINQKNLDFQAWKFEQEIALQKEMALFNRETQFAIVASQRETAQQQPEINKIFENWPLKNPPIQILNSHPNHLRVFISPPELDYDRFINLTDPKNHNFPRVESFLGSRLLKLLNQYYPRNSALRPTQLLDESWDSKRFAGSSSIIALADRLESEPLVVLETKVTLNKYLSLRVAYKDMGQKSYFYDEIIPRFEYGDILLAAYKARTGEIDPTDKQKIQITSDDWEALYEVLEVAHCIVAAWIADIHHLIHYNAQPLLPKLLPDITRELPSFLLADEKSVLNTLIQSVINGYQTAFQLLEKTERRYQVPELLLDLAQDAMSFPDKSIAGKQVKESIIAFLRSRDCHNLGVIERRELMEDILLTSDKDYFQKLGETVSSIGQKSLIPEANTLLQVWRELKAKLEMKQLRKEEEIRQQLEFERRQEERHRREEEFRRQQEQLEKRQAEEQRRREEEIRKQQEMERKTGESKRVTYHNLVAFPPASSKLKAVQWLHKSSFEHCEGELQIGDNGMICCERCDTQMPILEWYIVDERHLSELDFGGKQLDNSDAMSFAGQLVFVAGQKWMIDFLSNID
jgi:hypothetical protein